MPTLFFGIMSGASLLKNDILRVGGVAVGFVGLFASVINFVIHVIVWVG
jgi:hypothetical protein